MKMIKFFIVVLIFSSCQNYNPNFKEDAARADYIHRSMKQLTDVIVHDIISPPVAARDYVYPSIAGYEALIHDYSDYQSFAGQLNDLSNVPKPKAGKDYCFPLSGVHAFLETSKHFIFDTLQIHDFQKELYAEMDSAINMPAEVWKRSIAYGNMVANHILDWSRKDNYAETRTYSRYEVPFEDPSKWKPTPPDFMDGIEPHWNEIRTMVIESPNQFTPPPPTEFNADKNSQFFKETMEVYDVVKKRNRRASRNCKILGLQSICFSSQRTCDVCNQKNLSRGSLDWDYQNSCSKIQFQYHGNHGSLHFGFYQFI